MADGWIAGWRKPDRQHVRQSTAAPSEMHGASQGCALAPNEMHSRIQQHTVGHESVDISEWSALALNNIASVEADPDGGICVLCMCANTPGDGAANAMEFPGFPGFVSFTSASMSCCNCGRQSVIPLASATPYELIGWHDHATGRTPGAIGTVRLGGAG
jgi:hypothetical protein